MSFFDNPEIDLYSEASEESLNATRQYFCQRNGFLTREENPDKGVDLDVEASFNLSYRRLKPDEAKAFRLLSIFPADFDANSEEYLCKDRGHKNLSKFVRWSLVDF